MAGVVAETDISREENDDTEGKGRYRVRKVDDLGGEIEGEGWGCLEKRFLTSREEGLGKSSWFVVRRHERRASALPVLCGRSRPSCDLKCDW
jgi:hypothetical protein